MPENSDTISREAAKNALCQLCRDISNWRMCDRNDECNLICRIDGVPAADVRPVVKATWIVKEMKALFPGMDEHPVFACSECGYQIYDLLDNVKERYHFCPNCGADMRGEQDV